MANQSQSDRQCCCTTNKGRLCQIEADRMRDGKPYCHVHDPWGAYQMSKASHLAKRTPKCVLYIYSESEVEVETGRPFAHR